MIAALVRIFATLSLLAVGGANAVLPEMQHQVVGIHHWMTAAQFAALYALAQAAPGPNMLVSTLIGWQVAGLAGAFAATLALCLPACVLTYVVAAVWSRFRHAEWRRVVQAGLTPVTVGLVMGAAAVLVRATATGPAAAAMTAATVGVLLLTRTNPLWLLAVGAVLGAAGLL